MPTHIGESAPELSAEQQQLVPLLDGTRDVQHLVIDESGLVEFEVGKALFGLITAGFAHRVGTSAAAAPQGERQPGRRAPQPRRSRSTRPAMLDEALREFRRVADLRPTDASAPFFLGLIALRQARWEEAVSAFRQAIEKGGASARRRCTTSALALERLGRLDEAEAAYGDAAGRAREDARVMLGWGVVALKRGEYQVAQGRLARARELRGRESAAGALVLGRHPRARRASTTAEPRSAARGGRRGPSGQRGPPEQPRGPARAGRRHGRRRDDAPRRARRGPLAAPGLQEPGRHSLPRTAATRRPARPTSARPSSRPTSATISTSSSATSPTSGATTSARGRAGAARPS